MAQRKIISAIGTVIVIFSVCMVVLWFHQPQLQNVAGLIVMSEDMSCYLVDNTENPIIYEVDTEGNIVSFLRTAKEGGQQKIIKMIWDGRGLSYLKQIQDSQGQVFYKLCTCNARLEQEVEQGNITLQNGEKPLQLTKNKEQWDLVTLDKNQSKIEVYQISADRQLEYHRLVLKLSQEVEAEEQEWFCDAAYNEGRIYTLNYYGRVRCYDQGKRVKNKKLSRLKVTQLTTVRTGLCCQLRTGKFRLFADDTFMKLEGIKNLWALDVMSAKANVQLGSRETGEKYLIFYHSGEKVEVTSLKLPWRLWIPFCKGSLLIVIFLLILMYMTIKIIWFYLKKSKDNGALTVVVVIVQIGLGFIFMFQTAVDRGILLSKQQERTGQLWTQAIAERFEELDFYTMNLQELVKMGFFERLKTALKTQVFQVEDQWVQQSAMVVSVQTSQTAVVLAAGEYACGRQVAADIPWEVLQMIEEAGASGQMQTRIMSAQSAIFFGEKYNIVWSVLPVGERVIPSIFLISKLEIKGQNNQIWFWTMIGWLAVELCLSVVAVILQRNHIQRFVKAVEASIEGTRKKNPVHWRGVFAKSWVEIQKQLASLECRRNQQLEYQEKYDRFIPKNLTALMGQQEIGDLKIGEQCQVTGTFFHVLTGQPDNLFQKNSVYVAQINEFLELFNHITDASKRIIFSEGSVPGKFCIVYQEQAQEALQAAIEIWQCLNDNHKSEEQISIAFLLHYYTCICGLTGNKREVFPFVYAQEIKILEKCNQFLQQAQVRLAITEELLPYLKQNQSYRYIGYVKGAIEGKQLRFYEILEVYPESEKQKRIATAQKFSRALEQFYQNNFYLARVLFMEILKECPHDYLAKHNLFVCEQMFQAQSPQEISHQLVEIT